MLQLTLPSEEPEKTREEAKYCGGSRRDVVYVFAITANKHVARARRRGFQGRREG
jgi:hypothetical protein